MDLRQTICRGLCLALILAFLLGLALVASPQTPVPAGIKVREGCKLTVAVTGIKAPRFLRLAPDGALFVSVPDAGEIKTCRDTNGDGVYDQIATFTSGHPQVHGLFWHEGWLWFTESGAVFKARLGPDGKAEAEQKILTDLPHGGHWWRSILIFNNRLYTGIGDSGNITDETQTKREKIWSYTLDGADERLFCSGLRNTEKLVVRPGTDEIWGMDHGSDEFGKPFETKENAGQPITDLQPPDEMNHYIEGGFYGHPFIVADHLPRYEYLDRKDIVALAAKTIVPEWKTGAHWAPNAMEFYTADAFPGAKGDAFVAYHGSWNRTKKAGYCISRVLFEDGHPYGELVYVSFLTPGGEVLGRPVDCLQAPDGSLLISDDTGDKIYRLTYTGVPANNVPAIGGSTTPPAEGAKP